MRSFFFWREWACCCLSLYFFSTSLILIQ
jgi:hypothetical protein